MTLHTDDTSRTAHGGHRESAVAVLRRELDRLEIAPTDRVRQTIETLCDSLGEALDAGLPLRYLGDCALVSEEGQLRLSARELQRRQGPYSFFTRGFESVGLDDFTRNGRAFLVGAKGAVARGSGKLIVREVSGRYGMSDNFLAVTADPADHAYVGAVLNLLDAHRYARGSHAAQTIGAPDLRAAIVPWPAQKLRTQFADLLTWCESAGAHDMKACLQQAWYASMREVSRIVSAPKSTRPSTGRAVQDSPCTPTDGDRTDAGFLEAAERILDLIGSASEEVVDVVADTPCLETSGALPPARLCVCFPSPSETPWTSQLVDSEDARWIYGPPPKNKPHFAWIQHTIASMSSDGRALLLMRNAVLHSTLGREKALREAWAASGLIEAVIALPGGIYPDDRPPSSLIVLRKGRAEGAATLFINALGEGELTGRDSRGNMVRSLHRTVIERITDTYGRWLAGNGYRDQTHWCRSASPADIAAAYGNLAPWSYV